MAPSTTDWIAAAALSTAAVGTVGTLLTGLIQISNERSTRRRDEARARESDRRAQAMCISAWAWSPWGPEGITDVTLLNASESPVYCAVVSVVMIAGSGPRDGLDVRRDMPDCQAAVSVIPPGKSYTPVGAEWRATGGTPGVEIAFTDGAGVHWVRSADGKLRELGSEPWEYYSINPEESCTPGDEPWSED